MTKLRSWLRKKPLLVELKRRIWSIFDDSNGMTVIDMIQTFPLYVPYSEGRYKDKASLTILAINQIFPFLGTLSAAVNGAPLVARDIRGIPQTEQERNSALALKERLDFYGSDKAAHHDYHFLYGKILCDSAAVSRVFEIGLGTNNIDVVSNMKAGGRPGASLRAFRDHCPNAHVYGADIDKRVLFDEDRISTFFVDQTNPATFRDLMPQLPREFDLVIDDGLHSPAANVASLCFALDLVKVGGWIVIEDIGSDAIPLWQLVAALLPSRLRSHLYQAQGALAFVVERVG
jgi:hypothetical protein